MFALESNRMRLSPVLIILVLVCFSLPGTASGQLTERKPEAVRDVGVEEHLGKKIPLDIKFATVDGDSVTLGSLIEEGKPVLLNPVYYECPMLCSMVINAVFQTIKKIEWDPGKDYTIISFSFDPTENHKTAAAVKDSIMNLMSRDNVGKGWYFLTGKQKAITRLTEAIGFKYEKLEDRDQFAHTASIMFLSPQGKITRYLYGIRYKPFNVRNALSEAVDGKIGNIAEKVILYCFVYNAEKGSYTAEATRIMSVGGMITLTLLTIFLGFMWFGKQLFKNEAEKDTEEEKEKEIDIKDIDFKNININGSAK